MAKKRVKKDSHKVPERESKTSSNIIRWAVFLFSISIVLVSFASVLFPALIASSGTITIPNVPYAGPEPLEAGPWAVPVILANVMVFGMVVSFWKGKMPQAITKPIYRLFEFEISKKVALVTMLALLVIYIVPTSQEIDETEHWEDYTGVKERLQTWPDGASPAEPNVRYFFLKSSETIFGNDRVMPFLASISLLILTYYTTKQITQKRFAGIVSVVILMQSYIFLAYDTTVSYTNFWTVFYLLSLYLVYKKSWFLSPVSYIASTASKALTAVFLPMSVYFVLRADISKKRKLIVSGTITAIVIGGAITFASSPQGGEAASEPFNAHEFWLGFASFANQLRFDGLVLMFMIPLIVGLFVASRRGIKHAESIMVLISGMLIIAPILTGFTNQTNQPYRFVPLVVFFAIGVGVLLSKIKGETKL